MVVCFLFLIVEYFKRKRNIHNLLLLKYPSIGNHNLNYSAWLKKNKIRLISTIMSNTPISTLIKRHESVVGGALGNNAEKLQYANAAIRNIAKII